ncbi:MAG: hypothetical protein KME25_09275 [Symplocastrum torsivum CPER-KK1]|uniref:Uncharacterized protein n=1 Tax=Symplocastrum torsivum CPER-KK1 TaxID=450513 RepID=A0A951UAK3_9CYAN|nr:hypothetical protein [Symplocastrum torsivum CPER-KK1]
MWLPPYLAWSTRAKKLDSIRLQLDALVVRSPSTERYVIPRSEDRYFHLTFWTD